jgi:hypothetical protein
VKQGLAVSHATSGARGMRAILHRQIEAALAGLHRARATDEEIHEARKQMKAARATLCLLRPHLSEMDYRSENRMLRCRAGPQRGARQHLAAILLCELAQHRQIVLLTELIGEIVEQGYLRGLL